MARYILWKTWTRYIRDPLYRSSFFLLLSSLLNSVYGFVFWIAAAKLYSLEDIGIATAIINSLMLIIVLSRLGFDYSIIRFFPANNKTKIFNTSLLITTISSLFIGAAYILLIDLLSPSLIFLKSVPYMTFFLLLGVGESVASITGKAFVADRKADRFFIQNIFLSLRIPLLIPFVFFGPFGILSSVGLGYLAASTFGLLILRRKFGILNLKIDREFIKKSFGFSFWNYISNILSLAPSMILPIIVLNLLGGAEAAKYYIIFAIANLVMIIPTVTGTSLFVEGSYGEGLRGNVIRAGIISVILLIPAVIFLFIFGGFLLGSLNKDYLGGLDLLKVMALSSFPFVAYSIFLPIQNIRMDMASIVKINLIRFVLILGLSYMLIQKFGIIGAGYGWLITHMVLSLLIICIAKRENWI